MLWLFWQASNSAVGNHSGASGRYIGSVHKPALRKPALPFLANETFAIADDLTHCLTAKRPIEPNLVSPRQTL